MRKIISAATLALAFAAAPMLAAPKAQAQDFNIEIGPNGIRPVPQNRGYEGDRYEEPRSRGCSPRAARAAAREEGLRDAQVVRTSDRSITVRGFTRRGPETIRFANRPGCPTMG